MKPSEVNPTPVDAPTAGKEEVTGLPWLRTWRGVYTFVFGCFVLWVVLLFVLTMGYQ